MNEKVEVLKTASDYIINLKAGIKKAAEYFQTGEEHKGCNLISPITEGLQWLGDAIRLTQDIQNEQISLEDMNEKLNEIVEALENEDFILIGDLFEYELLSIIENIEEKVNKSITI
ncbi:MAG: hypothetical protein E7211_13410 [Clostridium lundense]|nr:hypothetical protein [Clostridium lundense]